jgi:twitching motility two-component system response regulator PilG
MDTNATQTKNSKTILLVENKELFIDIAQSSIEMMADHFHTLSAPDGAAALEIIKTSPIDLIITDLWLPGIDGFQLIEQMNNSERPVPFIVWTTRCVPETKERLEQLGCKHILANKPQDLNDLEDAIVNILSENKDDMYKGLSLLDLIEKIRLQGKSCTLTIEGNGKSGSIFINNGLFVNAQIGSIDGDSAAHEILGWNDAKIVARNSSCPDFAGKISDHLLAEHFSNRTTQKQTDAGSSQSEQLLIHAIQLIKEHHLNEGKKALIAFVRKESHNPTAWFWLSRVSQTIKEATKYLDHARQLDPRNSAIIKEIEKINIAESQINDAQMRRCPFCWSPLSVKTFKCFSCNSYMFFHEKMPLPLESVRAHIIEQAVERFLSASDLEANPNVLYFLALAYLHQDEPENALEHLKKSVKAAPSVTFLANQLQTLEKLLAITKDTKQSAPPQEKAASHDKKILVVEDSATTRRFIVKALTDAGYKTIQAGDGLEALSKLNAETPDLILLDIILPKMDGYKVLSIIRNSTKEISDIPVIMLTSKDGMFDKLKGRVAGSSAYLTKPFVPKVLIETIEKHV